MNKRREIESMIVPGIIGTILIFIILYILPQVKMTNLKFTGFIFGLLGGYLTIFFFKLKSKFYNIKTFLILLLFFSPLLSVPLLIISPQLGGGYFFGSAITMCFCGSLYDD